MEKSVRLALRLEDNEHFKCYFPEYKNMNTYSSTGVQIHGDSFSFTLSEMYTIPWYWRLLLKPIISGCGHLKVRGNQYGLWFYHG